MEREKIGKAIAYLRKRAGYTQKDLADRIGISDKAVSKWERGLGVPDISYFGKLAILLDTDTDSLLAGDILRHEQEWSGLLIIPENTAGVYAGTMVYDKPVIYFLIGYFLLVGIRQIYIVCSAEEQRYIVREFEAGQTLGMRLFYCGRNINDAIESLRDEAECRNVMVVFGRSFIYGVDQTRFFQRAMVQRERITILSLPKKIEAERSASHLTFNENRCIVDAESEDRIHTQYDYCEIPILFCPKEKLEKIMIDTANGSFDVDLSQCEEENIYTEVLDRGFVEMSLDDMEEVFEVSNFVRFVQNACGMEIYCLEEIAWRRGMISLEQMMKLGSIKSNTTYGKYIMSLAERYITQPKV